MTEAIWRTKCVNPIMMFVLFAKKRDLIFFLSCYFLGKIKFFKPTYTWKEVSTEHRIAVLHNYCTHDSLCQAFSGGENLSLAPNLSQWDQNFYEVSFDFSHFYIGFQENVLIFHLPFQNWMSLQTAKFRKCKYLCKSQSSENTNFS